MQEHNPTTGFNDIKPLEVSKRNEGEPNFFVTTIIICLIIALVLKIGSRFLFKKKELAITLKSPEEVVKIKITEVTESLRLKKISTKDAFNELSTAIREFFEGRLSFKAKDMTSEEIITYFKTEIPKHLIGASRENLEQITLKVKEIFKELDNLRFSPNFYSANFFGETEKNIAQLEKLKNFLMQLVDDIYLCEQRERKRTETVADYAKLKD